MAQYISKDALLAEIERRRESNAKEKYFGRLVEDNYFLDFINTLEEKEVQEEPVSNSIDFEKELYKAFGQVKDFTLGMRISKWFYDMGKNSQEPVSEVWHDMSESVENGRNIIIIDPAGFYGAVLRKGGSQLKNHNKERYVKWAYIDDLQNLSNVQRTVKNWNEPVSKDLGEYINELSKQFPEVSFAKLSRIAVRVAKWKEQQLMANAVEGVVHHFLKCKTASVHYNDPTGVPMAYFTFPEGLSAGDKVKIIVIKED